MDRPTLRIRVDLTGRGTYEIVNPDESVMDISNLVNAAVVKIDVNKVNTAVIRLIGFSLDMEVEGDLEVEGPGGIKADLAYHEAEERKEQPDA